MVHNLKRNFDQKTIDKRYHVGASSGFQLAAGLLCLSVIASILFHPFFGNIRSHLRIDGLDSNAL